MFDYRPDWTDAAVRRFIRRVGASDLPDLFALRRADNAASGVREPERGGLDELRARVGAELASHPLSARQLAIRGDDLTEALAIPPGPVVGRLLARLLETVLDDPQRNERSTLLSLAGAWLPEELASERARASTNRALRGAEAGPAGGAFEHRHVPRERADPE